MVSDSRTINTVRNILWGNIGNFIALLLQFVSRTIFIYTIGITYLGVNGLFINILGVLSFAELGIGTAMNYSLFKPMADRDYEKIKSLMSLYKKAHWLIAFVITVCGLILMPFLHYIAKVGADIKHLHIYYIVFLFNSVTSYFVTYKYSMVYVEQKNYILTNIDSTARCIITVIQAISLLVFKSFLVYLLIQSIVQLVQRLYTLKYINKRYPYLLEKKVQPLDRDEKKIIIDNVKALMIHKLGAISAYQTDSIIISTFINITVVGLISNYYLLISSVTTILSVVFNSFVSSLGNFITTESKIKQHELFDVYHFLGFWLFGFTTICFIVLTQPFIALWIGTDKQIDNISVLLIIMNQYLLGQRITTVNFKTAAGVYKEDQFLSILHVVVNVPVNILLIKIMGLPGLYLGALIVGLMSNIWRPVIVYRVIFNAKATSYFVDSVKYLVVTLITALLLVVLSKYNMIENRIVHFVLNLVITAIIPNIVFYFIFRNSNEFNYLRVKVFTLIKLSVKHAV